MLRRKGLVLVLIAAVAVLAASATAAPRRTSAETFKIGWITGLTGTQATNSAAATQGMAAALKVINNTHAAGKGIKFQMVVKDDAATPQVASQRCNELVNNDHVQAVIGFQSTPSQAACNQFLTSANIPYILAQTSTSGSICLPNYFALATVGNQQANPLVDYLLKHGSKKIYIVANDFSSGRLGAQRDQGPGRLEGRHRRDVVRAARHDRLQQRHLEDRGGQTGHGHRRTRRQRRGVVLQAVPDRPALERDEDRQLPDG